MSSAEYRNDYFGVKDAVHGSLAGYLFDGSCGQRSVDAETWSMVMDGGNVETVTGRPAHESLREPLYLLAAEAIKRIFPEKFTTTSPGLSDLLFEMVTVQDAQAITDGILEFVNSATTASEVVSG